MIEKGNRIVKIQLLLFNKTGSSISGDLIDEKEKLEYNWVLGLVRARWGLDQRRYPRTMVAKTPQGMPHSSSPANKMPRLGAKKGTNTKATMRSRDDNRTFR